VSVMCTIISGEADWKESVIYNDSSHKTDAVRTFGQIYDDHLSCVYRYINYRVGDAATAADLTSTVFEKALAAFKGYSREKASPQTWLIAIARNTVTDYLRRLAARKTIPLDSALAVESADPSPQDAAELGEEREVLRICFSLLQQREQEVVSLKFGAGFNNRNIASLLALSDNNVGAILFRTIRKLRQCFQEWQNGKSRTG
jgi:RNA polymerase sigma factor (sigma-70 family)